MSETKDCGCIDRHCNCDITGVCVSWDSECNCKSGMKHDTMRKLKYNNLSDYRDWWDGRISSSPDDEDYLKEVQTEKRKMFEGFLTDPENFFDLIAAEHPTNDDINKLGEVIKELMARVEELEKKQ